MAEGFTAKDAKEREDQGLKERAAAVMAVAGVGDPLIGGSSSRTFAFFAVQTRESFAR
jgi:hypothetical protein